MVSRAYQAVTGKELLAGGGEGATGIVISFPGFSGGKFDIGVLASATANDINVDGGSPLPSLPGADAGLFLGVSEGTASDLAGRNDSIDAHVNIGRKASNTIVDAVANVLPDGKVKNFVNGSVRKAANGLLGLTASGSVNRSENGQIGLEVGLSKGVNNGASASVEVTAVCTVRDGCSN